MAGTISSLELTSNLGIGANIIKDTNLSIDRYVIGANSIASNPTLPTTFWLITSLAILIANFLGTSCRHLAFPFNHIIRAIKGTSLGVSGSGITAWNRNMSCIIFVSFIKPFKNIQNVKIYKRFFDKDDIDEL